MIPISIIPESSSIIPISIIPESSSSIPIFIIPESSSMIPISIIPESSSSLNLPSTVVVLDFRLYIIGGSRGPVPPFELSYRRVKTCINKNYISNFVLVIFLFTMF